MLRKRGDGLVFALLGLAAVIAILWGCGQPYSPPEQQARVPAAVIAALGEMDARGLADWASYGRSVAGRITYGGEMPGFDAYADYAAQRIYVGDAWLAMTGADRGEVLLEELWHLRTRIMSHPPELDEPLEVYCKEA